MRAVVPDSARVLASAAHTINTARERVPWYASPWSPARSDHMADLLRRSRVHLVVDTIDGDALGMVMPECRRVFTMVVERETPRVDRMFIIRHELGHVLRGDVGEEPLYFTNEDSMDHAERVVDLFALADLIPGRILQDLRRARMRKAEILQEIRDACRDFASLDWADERVEDRAQLRLRLLKEFGI
jgi:Zn-dependent peptidase ImmA (M78 family)